MAKDWDFTLFSPKRLDRDHPYGLRRHRYFSSDRLYHYVIIADLVLRFSWLWRVLPGFAWIPVTESGVFMLMLLEVARRWLWVFFRIEAEWGMFHCDAPVPPFQPLVPGGKGSFRAISIADIFSETVRDRHGTGSDDVLLGHPAHKLRD